MMKLGGFGSRLSWLNEYYTIAEFIIQLTIISMCSVSGGKVSVLVSKYIYVCGQKKISIVL